MATRVERKDVNSVQACRTCRLHEEKPAQLKDGPYLTWFDMVSRAKSVCPDPLGGVVVVVVVVKEPFSHKCTINTAKICCQSLKSVQYRTWSTTETASINSTLTDPFIRPSDFSTESSHAPILRVPANND